MKRIGYAGLLVVILVLAVGCGVQPSTPANTVTLPDYVLSAFPDAQAAYRFAVEDVQQHPAQPELANYPCYCGCVYLGHEDNFDCYIQDVDAAGNITFDSHATGCGTCVIITLDVQRLKADGWSSLDVRRYIDDTYGKYGPPTDTPLPSA